MFQNCLNRRVGGANGAGISPGALASGIPFLLIAGKFLFVWIAPTIGNGLHRIKFVVGHAVLEFVVGHAVLEFVIAHSGIFMGAIKSKWNDKLRRLRR